MSHKFPRILLFLAICLRAAVLRGDDQEAIERALKAKFQGKVQILRHFYQGTTLQFDETGQLTKSGLVGAWTLYSTVEVVKVNLRGNKLEMWCRRVFLKYDDTRKKFQGVRSADISIEIKLGLNTNNLDAILNSVYKVFLSSDETLEAVAPPYWTTFLVAGSKKKAEEKINAELSAAGVSKITPGEVSAPSQVFSPSPDYTKEAREAKYMGTVVLSLVVNTRGQAEDISIVKALGMGLDDNAVATVQKWKFNPALRNGTPVPVRVLLEITYSLHG